MAISIRELRIRITADDSPYRKTLKEAREESKQLGSNLDKASGSADKLGRSLGGINTSKMRGVGTALTIGITAPLAALSVKAFQSASDLEESQNKVKVVFGDSASAILSWSQTTANALGQSQNQALGAAGTFGNLFSSMGLGQQESSKMSMSLVQLASDLASFNNIDPSQALDKLRSGLVGEAEPMRALGVMLTETTVKAKAMEMGLADSSGELSEAAKVQARYALILAQTGNAQGDFSRTADGAANMTRQVKAEFEDLTAQVGKELLPIGLELLKMVRGWLKEWKELDPSTKNLIKQLVLFAAATGPVIIGLSKIIDLAVKLKTLKGLSDLTGLATGGGARGAVGGAAGRGILAGVGARLGLGATTLAGGSAVVGGAAAIGVGWTAGNWLTENLPGGIPGVESGEAFRKRRALNQFYERGGARAVTREELEARRPSKKKSTAAAALGPKPLSEKERSQIEQAGEAEFAFMSSRAGMAGAMAPEGMQARAELQAQSPLLQQRYKQLLDKANQLQPNIQKDAKAREEYYTTLKEASDQESSLIQLQQAAQKEVSEHWKKAEEERKDQQAEWFDILTTRAEIIASDVEDELKAQSRAEELIPVLLQKMQTLTQRDREYWDIAKQINDLKVAAADEVSRNIEQEEKARADTYNAWVTAKNEMIKAQIEALPESERAAAEADRWVPILRDRQQAIVDSLQTQIPEMEDYWKNVEAYWQIEGEIQQKIQNKQKAQEELTKKAAADQRKLADIQLQFAEESLKQNPFLNAYQKQQAMIPIMVEQYRQMLQPISGESQVEAAQRQLQALQMRGSIYEQAGITNANLKKTIGGGVIPMWDMRQAGQLEQKLNAPLPMQQARALAADSTQGRPVVFQAVIDPMVNAGAFEQRMYQALHDMIREVFPSRAYGTGS